MLLGAYVDNDSDGSSTASIIGDALEKFKFEHEDLNCMKNSNVYYSTDGQYSFVAPKGKSSIDIQAGFAGVGAEIPVKYKSQNILLSYEQPPYYYIPVGKEVTDYVDKEVNLDLKIGETSTNPDRLELKLYDFHTDHIFEPAYEEKVTGTRTVFEEVTTPSKKAYASVGGTKNTQKEYSYPGAAGGVRQEVISVPIIERVNTGAATRANDISTYKKAIAPDISTQEKATKNIDAIKKASDKISSMRGEYGAKQNRIEHTINVLTVDSENTLAAKSRLKDTDMAAEFTKYTSQNIITQAAQSLFAQANSKPQDINSLLQN